MAETRQKLYPKVSIIVPVYNTARYLARCLDSIAAQTFTDWECICVDDGSTDESGAMLDAYARRDARFRVIHQENGGVSRARNAGLDAARGEYVGFVDSDDWVEPETYELAYEAAAAHNADLVQWDYVFEDNGKRIVGLSLAEGPFSVSKNATYFCPSMWHKLVFLKLIYANHLLFPENIRLSEDRLFSFQCSLLARRAFHLNRALYHYTANASSASHNMTREMILEEVEVVKEMEKFSLDFERNAVLSGGRGGGYDGAPLLFAQKLEPKLHALLGLPKPDAKLCRAVFPETNRKLFGNFLRKKTRSAFLLLLAALRMDFLVRLAVQVRKVFMA